MLAFSILTIRLDMGSNRYPDNLPKELQSEYDKYLADPKKYQKLHPVCYKLIIKYIRTSNVKEESKRQSSK